MLRVLREMMSRRVVEFQRAFESRRHISREHERRASETTADLQSGGRQDARHIWGLPAATPLTSLARLSRQSRSLARLTPFHLSLPPITTSLSISRLLPSAHHRRQRISRQI